MLAASNKHDIAVIGTGVFGAWSALKLREAGHRVLLVDAYGPGNSRSSSGDESRIIRMGYGADEIYTRSANRSLQLWRELFAEIGENLFLRTGVLWLAHEDDPYPAQTLETLQRVGIKLKKLTTEEISAHFPQFALDEIAWGMLEPESGVLLARRAVQAVVRKAIQIGVTYLQTAVEKFDESSSQLDHLKTVGGERVSASSYVFACGPWLPKIFPALLSGRINPTRQEVFYFGTLAGDTSYDPAALPTWIDFKEELYGLPNIEARGLKIAIDRHGPPFDPDLDNRVVSAEGLAEVRRALARRLLSLREAPVTEARVCQYENTSNGDFLIDRHPNFDNVWLVGGGSGHGFKHGPVVGEYVADRIEGRQEGIEPRFSLTSKGKEKRRRVY